ncbi:MAG: CapA family protein [Candidatus Magasanikbacteria bacterium]|nr:CapA family protein [Candidatus Magasanikbacteria bacterium]
MKKWIAAVFAIIIFGTFFAMRLLPVQAEKIASPNSLYMIFAGDIMLDRNVFLSSMADHNNFEPPFLLIAPELTHYDVRVANLEGPITDAAFNAKRAHAMSFTFNPKFAPELVKHFDVVSLANNHTYNFQQAGLDSTKKYLVASGVQYFGDPLNRKDGAAWIVEKNGFKIAFVGYHAFSQPEKISVPIISDVIRDMKTRADFVIVMPHWGVEYAPKQSRAQIAAGHAFIDAGADAVIGGHPHVVEPMELYKGKPIYYSLGNFIFDQYFSKETMQGEMVSVVLTRDADGKISPQFSIVPFKINKASQPYIESP